MMPGLSAMSSGMASSVRRNFGFDIAEAAISGKFAGMANPHDNPAALKELQDSIYREKVLRAPGP